MKLLMTVMLVVAAFCVVRAAIDFKAQRFVWGTLGFVAGVMLVVTPIPTHAVKFDLPVEARRGVR